jgi:CTP:molybdopterin cytidylyltransferase MocA
LKNISAIILAAGSGKRIGTPKLKLKIGEDYFVNLIVDKLKLAGIKNIVCVIRKDDKEWFEQNTISVTYVENPNPDSGMIHSVFLGINYFKDSSGCIVFPVDHPLVKTDTIRSLIKVFQENIASIVKPGFKSISGHPVIIPDQLFGSVLNKENENLNNVILSSGLSIIHVDVEDEGILKNINYKTDLDNA